MRKIVLLTFAVIFASAVPVLAGNQSNNLLLADGCQMTTEKLTPLWKINLIGNVVFTPVAANDGSLIVATDKEVGVVNSNSGLLTWFSKLEGGCKWNVVLSSNSSVCAFKTNEIVCLSLREGKTLWTRKLDDGITAQPVSDGENIYVVTGKIVYGIDSSKGNQVWEKTIKNVVNVSPCISNGKIVVSSLVGYCTALDARDGAIEWESKPGEQPTDALVTYDKNIYMVCDKSLFALDSTTGKPIWKFVAKSKGFSPTVTDDALLYPTSDKTLYSLDPKTCGKGCCLATPKQLWQLNKNSMLPGRVAASTKSAYLATEDGWVNVIDIQKGDVISKHEIGSDLANSVFLSGQVVVPAGKSLRSFASIPGQVEVFIDKPFINRDRFQISVGVGAKIVNGKSMLPASFVLEPYGGSTNWDSKTRTMICNFEGKKLEVKLGSNIATINGKQVKLDPNSKVTPVIVAGRVMLPARFLAETYMGYKFVWNEVKKSFSIGRGEK